MGIDPFAEKFQAEMVNFDDFKGDPVEFLW